MRRDRTAAAGLVLAAGALILSATPVQARPAPPAQPPGQIESMQRDLGLTADQAVRRLAAERRAADLAPALRTRLADRFGGSWMDETGALVVATTDAADVRALTAAGARPVVVGRSLADLESIVDTLNRASAPGQAIRGWHADVRANHVVVLAADTAAGEAFVRASGVDRAAVRVEVTAERPVPYRDVRGGDPFYLTNAQRCVIGFTVRQGKKQGFVTAGHCLKPRSDGTPPSTIGKVEGWSYPGDDYAWASLDPESKAVGLVGRPVGIPIAGSTEAQPGTRVCAYGATVSSRCGTVQQYNATINYPDGTVTGLIRTTICSQPSDSGAPLLAGNQAQGVLSGGTGNCSVGGTSYFQPINEVLAVYGLTLITAISPPGVASGR
ncbi:serine protease [Spongiactinospora gelatinilytica]|uniref:Serine protease n=1 Tax=Spongiactinospora gelatinilytica TaxID=2666298 RepID=A0A2W2H284_9ACTN|nr:S1 family peptidase [Spongiactinospora gelatinilytica]PZG43668.1 serine protease [Spongiactinospora gelatinilytica]